MRRPQTAVQLPLSTWHDVIGEPTFADAILDRIVHNAYRLELSGQSLRKTMAKTKTAKGDIEKLTPQRSAPQVAGYSGLGGQMLSEWVAEYPGMRRQFVFDEGIWGKTLLFRHSAHQFERRLLVSA